MKKLGIALFLISLLASCHLFQEKQVVKNAKSLNSTPGDSSNSVKIDTISDTSTNLYFDKSIIKVIADHYYDQYNEPNFYSEDGKSPITVLKQSICDSFIVMSYSGQDNHSHETTIEDYYSHFIIDIKIPLKKLEGRYLEGDINHDNKKDLIVIVFTEGCGTGCNDGWYDYFVFIQENGHYKLKSVIDDDSISGCEGSGAFAAISLENNIITGESWCHKKGDGRCCPTLSYKVKVAYVDSSLKVISMERQKDNVYDHTPSIDSAW
jgi:hypothetical protein